MRTTLMYGAGDVRVEQTARPTIEQPTDAVVRVVRAAVCGTDLHGYRDAPPVGDDPGVPQGHEVIGVVEQAGSSVTTVREGDLVVASFSYQDDTCALCRAGAQTACPQGGFLAGAQADAVRVPWADGTLTPLPVGEDSPLLPSLLTLADVYGTGHHGAVRAGVGSQVRPDEPVVVVGDGAVGLLAVLASRRLGAERIVLMGRHVPRTDLGRRFGATDVVADRGEDGVRRVLDLTDGLGAPAVVEAVGHRAAYEQAAGVVRAGGTISRVGVPQYDEVAVGPSALFGRGVTLTGGPAPVRRYVAELLPGVLDGTVEPGLVFDHTVGLDEIAEGYRSMSAREALKVLVVP